MTVIEKIKTIDSKTEKTNLNTIWIEKHLRYQLYHQKTSMNF